MFCSQSTEDKRDQNEIQLLGEAYDRAVAIFDEIAPEPPSGLSREMFLDLVMQATVCGFTLLLISYAEQDNKSRAVISAIDDHAPTTALEAKPIVQMLTTYEVIIACQHRLLNQHMPSQCIEAILKQSFKALEI